MTDTLRISEIKREDALSTFNDDVVLFKCSSVGFVGNVANGAVAAITEPAFKKCDQVLREKSEWEGFDPDLDAFLSRNAFFDNPQRRQSLFSAYVHITDRCNLDCFACYAKNVSGRVIEDPTIDELCFLFAHLGDLKTKIIYISGGEPFLRKDLLLVLESAKKYSKCSRVVLLTNGTLVEEGMAEMMGQWVDGVSVSLDAVSSESECRIRGENRLDEIIRSIMLLKRANIPVSITSTIHAENIGDIPEYVRLAEDLGVKLHFSLITPAPSCVDLGSLSLDESSLRRIYSLVFEGLSSKRFSLGDSISHKQLAVRKNCGAGSKTISVTADGRVFPCHMLHYDELCMGNAFQEGGLKKVMKDAANGFHFPEVGEIPSCSVCELKYFCGGGCRAGSMAKNRHLKGEDALCPLSKEHYRALVSDIANRSQSSEMEV